MKTDAVYPKDAIKSVFDRNVLRKKESEK
jgi:hypothetical protein